MLEPLFEFSGACGGCGETPYIRLVSQLFGDRMIVANATGCSSIYGANLPTTPWTVNAAGRGPAWNNSLFEDNAEFGLGMRLALDAQTDHARLLLSAPRAANSARTSSRASWGPRRTPRPRSISSASGSPSYATELARIDGPEASDARHLLTLAGDLVRKGVWIIGGDGWAYDIGFGGVDQVLSSGRNVNILVLDTEVYSNTGGQASKATPRGAVAKFAAAGKGTAKKDLGAIARSYGNVFVAQVSMGANDLQTTKALLEADAWPGPSLVIAYSTCIAHGIDMSKSMTHQKDAVKSGYWPLYRFRPSEIEGGKPFKLDSNAPSIPIADFVATETRFAVLQRTHPERAAELAALAQADADERWRYYEQLAGIERTVPHVHRPDPDIVPEVESDAGYRYESEGGPGMTVDLRTRYLGLDLRSPIVASAAPQNAEPAHGPSPRARRRRCDRASLAVRGGDPGRGDRAQPLARAGHRAFRRGTGLLPERRGFVGAADRYLAAIERVKAQAEVPIIASLNAQHGRGMGPLRAADRGCGRGCARAEPVPPRGRSASDRGRDGRDRPRTDRGRPSGGHDPTCGQAQPLLLGTREFRHHGGPRPGADGLVLFNRFYQPDLDLDSLEVVPRLELSHAWEMRLPVRWIAILRPQLGSGDLARGDVRRPGRERRGQGPDGRRRRRDDDVGAAAPRPRARRRPWRPSFGRG